VTASSCVGSEAAWGQSPRPLLLDEHAEARAAAMAGNPAQHRKGLAPDYGALSDIRFGAVAHSPTPGTRSLPLRSRAGPRHVPGDCEGRPSPRRIGIGIPRV